MNKILIKPKTELKIIDKDQYSHIPKELMEICTKTEIAFNKMHPMGIQTRMDLLEVLRTIAGKGYESGIAETIYSTPIATE